MIRRLMVLAMVLTFAGAGSARADMTWDLRTETTVKVGSETRALPATTKTYAAKNNVLRIDSGVENPTQFINTANGAVLFVSYQTASFLLLTFPELSTAEASEREAMRAKLPLMELGLANLPPDQQAEQRALIDGQRRKYELWSRPYTVRATTTRAEVLGHPCVKWEGLAGDEVFQEIWVADDLKPDQSFRASIAPGLASLDPQQYQHHLRVPGVALKIVSFYGPVTVTDTVNRYTTAAIPADAFIIPDDFRETQAASKRNQ